MPGEFVDGFVPANSNVSRADMERALDHVFASILAVTDTHRNTHISLDRIDQALEALCVTVNEVRKNGKIDYLPDFYSILVADQDEG